MEFCDVLWYVTEKKRKEKKTKIKVWKRHTLTGLSRCASEVSACLLFKISYWLGRSRFLGENRGVNSAGETSIWCTGVSVSLIEQSICSQLRRKKTTKTQREVSFLLLSRLLSSQREFVCKAERTLFIFEQVCSTPAQLSQVSLGFAGRLSCLRFNSNKLPQFLVPGDPGYPVIWFSIS